MNLAELVVLVVGVVITLLQLNDIKKTRELELDTRQADFLLRQTEVIMGTQHQEAWFDVVFQQRFSTGEDWFEKYGPNVNPGAYNKLLPIIQYYNHLGVLLMENMIPVKMLETITPPIILMAWKRIEPLAVRWRLNYEDDTLLEGFEYLVTKIRENHPNIYDNLTIPTE